jgi:hypothetical protein
MTLKGIDTDKAILFSCPFDPFTDEREAKDPNMINLEALLTARGVHPSEIRGFDTEREEAFRIDHRAVMERYRERMKTMQEKYEAVAVVQKGKANKKSKRG